MSQDKDNNEAASADLIARIVDRDTPPDGRNDVVDHDLRGNPITRGMVDSMAKAASASQSSTAGAAKRGETSDEFTDKLRRLVGSSHQNFDEILAHVARQRQESAAVAEGVDTALPPPALTVADEPGRGHYYTAEQMAQQREAGRREQMDRVRLMEGQRDIAQATCREFSKALDEAARARQPVSEVLTNLTRYEPTAEAFGEGGATADMEVDPNGEFVKLADVQALSAVPPAKAEGMSDEQISRVIREVAELPDRDSPADQPEMMLVSADELRAILAQQAKKGGAA